MSEDKKDLNTARICVMVLLPTITLAFGVLPTWLAQIFKWDKKTIDGLKGKRAQSYFSLLLCFAGGVLMATVFMHLLPELENDCKEQVEIGNLPDLGEAVPWAMLFLSCGFFFVYFVEELAHSFVTWQKKGKSFKPAQPTPSIVEIEMNSGKTKYTVEDPNKTELQDGSLRIQVGCCAVQEHIILDEDEHSVMSNVRNVLTILALSCHCFFEGFAVGMEDTTAGIWYLFSAISSHKYVLSFCIGVEMLACNTKTILIYIYTGIFGLSSTFGIAGGWIIVETGSEGAEKHAAAVVLQGMAMGTILYVTFFEILQNEKSKRQNSYLQLASIIIGFVCMSLLMSLGKSHQ
ncbi:Hypothetical predicted protein [Cloeon dipterum]|nr:Hypothetical predicted protein [Cloeon dipterum]